MKTISRAPNGRAMSAEAYAGFLKLWLTSVSRPVEITDDVAAYLEYVSGREPLSDAARRAAGLPTGQAA
jgi:hypothetical protein